MKAEFGARAAGNERDLKTALVLEAVCLAILIVDVGGEIHVMLLPGAETSLWGIIHVASEVVATIGLVLAILMTVHYLRRIKSRFMAETELLHALRGAFDDFLSRRFAEWGLSAAERDVALLTVRGLKIVEIADMRRTQAGTIKAQLSRIFRKSGVSSRTELVARFIDEFLDISSLPVSQSSSS